MTTNSTINYNITEKTAKLQVTLTISILVSLIFFLSVLIETIPSTSLAMPLLGKYLVFTMILITVSVCATVCVLNIHFRTPSTHSMPAWVKRWCIEILPRYLFMNVPQYQSSQQAMNLILPEQLIYPHNQAYAAQQQHQQHYQNQNQQLHPLEQQQQQQQHQTTDISWPSAKVAAEYIKANHSSEFGQNSFAAVSSSAPNNKKSSTNNNHHQSNTPLPAASEFRQLDVGRLKKLDPKQPSKAVASVGVASLNISPSSLFLPYLQSEAARRLQMQRSRSSDRGTSDHQVGGAAAAGPTRTNTYTINNNLLQYTTSSTTNNNSCDNNQFSPPSKQQPLLAAKSNQRNNTFISTPNNNTIDMQHSLQNDGSTKNRNKNSTKRKSSRNSSTFNPSRSKSDQNKTNQREKLVKSDKRSFIRRIFAPKLSGVIKEEENGSNSSDIEASRATILDKATNRKRSKSNLLGGALTAVASKSSHQLQHDTSSSFENDYQYHNHFQARASICSTNIWRVGPSRRCSVAVPTNYPTFYQPALAQIAHPASSTSQQQHQNTSSNNQPLSTLSGCVANHNHPASGHSHHHQHYHNENLAHTSDSSDSSTRSGAINALVKATTTKLTLPSPRLNIIRPSTSCNLNPTSDSNHAVSGEQELRQLNPSFINRINQANSIPNYNHFRPKQQNQLKQPASNLEHHLHNLAEQPDSTQIPTPTPPPPPPLSTSSPTPNNDVPCHRQHQLLLNPANLNQHQHQQQQQHFAGQVLDHQHQGGLLILNREPSFHSGEQINRQQPVLYHVPANQHVNLNHQGSKSSSSVVNSRQKTGISSLSSQFGQSNQQPIVYRVIPRSRSTDYRLCQHGTVRGYVSKSGDETFCYAPRKDQSQLLRQDETNMFADRSIFNDQTLKEGFNVTQQKSMTNQQQVGMNKYLLQGPHTIGRALGQAYMQRLERQPTIYSLHSTISNTNSQNRPSRSFQRAYLKPLVDQHGMGQSNWQNSTQLDNTRRSKSQTSLNRRAQFDCDQCNFSVDQPWLINSDINNNNNEKMRGHHQACSYDLSGQQSSGQHLGVRSLKCRGCCSPSMEHNHRHHLNGPQMSCCSSEHSRCDQNICGPDKQASSSVGQCNLSLDQRRQISDTSNIYTRRLQPLSTLGLMKLIGDVDKAIQNAMFIAQHIDNLDEFESVSIC